MAKFKVRYVCQNCGAVFPKWYGKCPQCGAWNTIVEEIEDKTAAKKSAVKPALASRIKTLDDIELGKITRIKTHINELDRVLGGGIVPGSLILLAGEPGIGKSTLALQLAEKVEHHVLYVSGEESLEQIKLRAQRLGINSGNLAFVSEINLETILATVEANLPKIVIIDSIQTLFTEVLESSAGSVSQIRECTAKIQQFAKRQNIAFILIGHITKEGMIAGPKVLEHIVDVVLHFEGDKNYFFRILRSIKNRFGSTSELGIFQMSDKGLEQVLNPSEILMSQSSESFSGVSIAASVEGMRTFLIEIQALVAPAVYGTPQRATIGYDLRRLNMLIAVLEKRLGLKLGKKDIFLNIAGGIKVDDPAIDLAVLASIISSDKDIEIPRNVCFAAEVGLTGEIRPVFRLEQRIAEAKKLGFKQIFISKYAKLTKKDFGITLVRLSKVAELYAYLLKFFSTNK